MFSVDIGGRTIVYQRLEQIAGYCYDMAHANRNMAAQVERSQQFHIGKAEAYGTIAVVINSIRIGGSTVATYVTDLQAATKAAEDRATEAKRDLGVAQARIEELEKLVQDVDHIGDAHQ